MIRRSHPHLLLAVILVELFDDLLASFDFAFELLTVHGFFPIFLAASHEEPRRLVPSRIFQRFLF